MASPLKAPTPGVYRAAQLLARSRAGALSQEAASRVLLAVNKYVDSLTGRVASLPAGTPAARQVALAAAAKIAAETRDELVKSLGAAVAQKRDLAFREVFGMWQEAGRKVATASGVPDALLGAIESPNLTMAGAFEALGGVPFMTSLTATGKAASAEVAAILREGITNGVRPDELARRLRPYVAGAEAFEAAFPKADDRLKALHVARSRLPKELRGAAGRVRSNSLRIAYSEIHNARAEAELQAFALDPLVGAVRWSLSPFRGSQATPCVCDALASNNWYGLGVGIYPIDAVPLPPHPRDRCEREPVMRPPEDWGKPKPVGLKRTLKPVKASLGPNAKMLTQAQAAALRDTVRGQLQQLEQHASAKAMRGLIGYGNEAAGELLEIAAARQILLAELAQAAADAEAAALAAASEPTTIGLITFPHKLADADSLEAAKVLYAKAAYKKSTAALQVLKSLGADTTQLEAHLAALKAKAVAKKAAKKAAPSPAVAAKVEPPKPTPAPAPIAPPPAPVAPPAFKLKVGTPTAAEVAQVQDELKGHGVFLLTKQKISDHFDEALQALAAIDSGGPDAMVGASILKGLGADIKQLEKKLGVGSISKPMPVPKAPEPPPVAPAPAAIATESAENVLAQKVGAQAGSNAGGFYVGKDGVKRYVKVYADASQAHGEVLANAIYRELGLGAPESFTFMHAGKLHYASRIIEGVGDASTFGKLGLTADRARKALDGFAADLLTGNWDAPGLSFDNLVEVGGKVYRIDNGSAFLFRAMGDRKPTGALSQLTEWEGFAPGAANKNPQYAQLFQKAGLSSPEQLGAAFVKQVDDILALEAKHGGWVQFVDNLVPTMAAKDRVLVKQMLFDRVYLLKQRRAQVAASLTKAVPVPAPVTAPPAAAVQAAQAIDHGALAKKIKMQWAVGAQKTAAEIGVTGVDPSYLQGHGLKLFKKSLLKAAQGNQHALNTLQSYFKANVSGLQKKLGLTPTPLAVPAAPAPVVHAVPKVPAGPLIKPADVPGVQAASKVQQPVYFNAGNTTATGLKASGVDLSKLPAGQMGFELSAEQAALTGVQKVTLKAHVVAQNPLVLAAGDDAVLLNSKLAHAVGKSAPAWNAMSAAAKRQTLIDAGYDAVVVKDFNDKVTRVIALKADAVKFVDEVVKPITPAAATPAPAAAKAAPKGPVGARVSGGLGGRTKASDPLTAVAGESDTQRRVREARLSLRAQLTDSDRDYLAQHVPTSSVQGSAQYRKVQEWRKRESVEALVGHGVARPQAEKVFRSWCSAIDEWLGSSSSGGASIMKLAAEDAHGLTSTTYHGRYFDHNAAQRKKHFLDTAEARLNASGITREQLRLMYEIEERLNRAFLMDILNVAEGETFKVWRGVSDMYFHSHHITVPAVGEEVVITFNSLSSFSMNRPFGGVVMELEATLDDVAMQHALAQGGLGSEAEIWIIGRPRKMKRVK